MPFDHSGFAPSFDDVGSPGERAELVQQGIMVDAVETFFDIRLKDRAGCFGDAVVDIPDGIVC